MRNFGYVPRFFEVDDYDKFLDSQNIDVVTNNMSLINSGFYMLSYEMNKEDYFKSEIKRQIKHQLEFYKSEVITLTRRVKAMRKCLGKE